MAAAPTLGKGVAAFGERREQARGLLRLLRLFAAKKSVFHPRLKEDSPRDSGSHSGKCSCGRGQALNVKFAQLQTKLTFKA